jgi:hypothetical protein
MASSPSAAFLRLREFIAERMRMSHIYQPLMLLELLSRQGQTPEDHGNSEDSIELIRCSPKRRKSTIF